MKKPLFLLIVFVLAQLVVDAQDYHWAKSFASGTGAWSSSGWYFESGKAITTDAAGNVYITGSVPSQTVDFDPGPGTAILQPGGSFPYNIFFSKYDASGNYLWAKTITTWGYGSSIAVDASGNVFITGLFNDVTDFDPGPGTATLNSFSSSWSPFFAKYDSNGDYVWAKSINGLGSVGSNNNESERNGIVVDNTGNVYVTGRFYGTTDFDPSAATATIAAQVTGTAQYSDVFYAKYDQNGNYVWAKSIRSPDADDVSNSIKVDASGNVYLTGLFRGTADFDPSAGTATLTAFVTGATLYPDAFFAKYDSNGNYVWAKNIASTNKSEVGNSIEVDGFGNVYVAGNFDDVADFDPSTNTATLGANFVKNIFFAKYDASGNYVWAKCVSTSTNGNVMEIGCNALALDAAGNLYITGGLIGNLVDFDPGPSTQYLTTPYAVNQWGNINNFWGSDIYFAKYDNSGNCVWVKMLNRVNLNNDNLYSKSNSIAVSSSGNVHITGYFETETPTTLDFDPGPGTATLSAMNGKSDIFFAKYNSCPAPAIAASSGSICPGQTYTMTLAGASTYSINGSSAVAYTFSPLSSAVYSITGTNSLACSSAYAITATISVGASPSITANNGSVCAGQVYTINAAGAASYSINGLSAANLTVSPISSTNYSITGVGGNGCVSANTAVVAVSTESLPLIAVSSGSICAGGTYSINISGASSYSLNGAATSNFTVSPSSTTTYSFSGAGSNGCVSANPAVATVTVYALPFVNAASGVVCTGKIFTLNVSGASTYSINGNNATSFTFIPTSNTSYSVTGASSVGCMSSNTAVAAVTVYSLPIVSAVGGSVCSGKIFTMNVAGANTYSANGIAIFTPTFSPTSNTTYSITGSNAQGCVSANTAIASVTVSASPSVSVNSPSTCAGQTILLIATGADTYLWSTNQAGASLNVAPVLTSVYTVTGTSSGNGCSRATTATVTVHTASISISGNSTVCANETNTLTASGGNTYTWSTGQNGSNISINLASTATYSVHGTDDNGCEGNKSFTIYVDECTELMELGKGAGTVRLYPNPAATTLNIEFVNTVHDPLFIFDSCGREVLRTPTEGNAVQLDLANFPKGIYFIRVGQIRQKFLKE